jgi:hypothetical protein
LEILLVCADVLELDQPVQARMLCRVRWGRQADGGGGEADEGTDGDCAHERPFPKSEAPE